MAGVGRMEPRRYFTYSLIGGVAWAAGVTVLGYWLGQMPVRTREHRADADPDRVPVDLADHHRGAAGPPRRRARRELTPPPRPRQVGVLADPRVHGDPGRDPGVHRAGRAELRDRHRQVAPRRGPRRSAPGPPARTAARTSRGSSAVSSGTAPGRLSTATTVEPGRAAKPPGRRRRRGGARAGTGRSPSRRGGSSAADRRCAPPAAPNAFAVRTTVPMLWSWPKFSIATWNGCARAVEVGDDAVAAPVAVGVDDVARSPCSSSSGS